ncbi:MAG: hypothetical protein H7X88_07995, partial [Gloeobacteraceae cyanobacterium ES-bin-316]|nr:hypothetical protein [Ferruginibacter sp.]
MKKHLVLFFAILMSIGNAAMAQKKKNVETGKRGLSWYVTPELSTLFLDNHVGKAVGISFGLNFFNDHFKVGVFNYGRSGPINSKTFKTTLPTGKTYKGKQSIDLRADHGAFGVMLAPAFRLPKSGIEIDFPIYIGSIGAGFYLAGDDRKTPDGRKVSEWENELFGGKDAAFAGMMEYGARVFFPTKLN